MDAANLGVHQASKELNSEVNKVEKELKVRLPMNWKTSLAVLQKEMCEGKGYSVQALNRALDLLQRKDVVAFTNQGSQVLRKNA